VSAAATGCSAGLLGQLRTSAEQVQLVQRTFRAIRDLQAELDDPIGFRDVGSLRIASTPDRERDRLDPR